MKKRIKKKLYKRMGFKTYKKYEAVNKITVNLSIHSELPTISLNEYMEHFNKRMSELREQFIEAFTPLIVLLEDFKEKVRIYYDTIRNDIKDNAISFRPKTMELKTRDLKIPESLEKDLNEYHKHFMDNTFSAIPKEIVGYDEGSGSDATGHYMLNFKPDTTEKEDESNEDTKTSKEI